MGHVLQGRCYSDGDWAESFKHVIWLPADSRKRREGRWRRRLGNMTLRGMLNRYMEQGGWWGSLIVLCTLWRKTGKLTGNIGETCWTSQAVELRKQLHHGSNWARGELKLKGNYEAWVIAMGKLILGVLLCLWYGDMRTVFLHHLQSRVK